MRPEQAGTPSQRVYDARVGCVAKKGRALYHEDLVGTMLAGTMPYACPQVRGQAAPKSSAYPMHVTIKTPEEQEKMRIAGRLAADVLDMIGEHVVPGVVLDPAYAGRFVSPSKPSFLMERRTCY